MGQSHQSIDRAHSAHVRSVQSEVDAEWVVEESDPRSGTATLSETKTRVVAEAGMAWKEESLNRDMPSVVMEASEDLDDCTPKDIEDGYLKVAEDREDSNRIVFTQSGSIKSPRRGEEPINTSDSPRDVQSPRGAQSPKAAFTAESSASFVRVRKHRSLSHECAHPDHEHDYVSQDLITHCTHTHHEVRSQETPESEEKSTSVPVRELQQAEAPTVKLVKNHRLC